MTNLFFATLGQRPEAITSAYDRLCERYTFERLIVLTTDRRASGIASAAAVLEGVCRRDYPTLPVTWHELRYENGAPLMDILDAASAMAYFRGVYSILAEYKRDHYTLHFLISGGRKAMSLYASFAAGLVFGGQVRLWAVLSSDEMVKRGGFHSPPGMRDQVQVVELPLLPARILPGSLNADGLNMESLTQQRAKAQENFLHLLTPSERETAQLLAQHRYASNQQLAEMRHVSRRTVESQLLTIYPKLASYVDFGDQIQDKRQALIDFLREGLS